MHIQALPVSLHCLISAFPTVLPKSENNILPECLSVGQSKSAATNPEHTKMFFLDNVMFAMWYLPFSFFHLPCPGTPESKNTIFSAAKTVKSLCMFLLFPLLIPFVFLRDYLSLVFILYSFYLSSNISKIPAQDMLLADSFFFF